MRYKKWQILVFLCCVTMVLSSCVRNMFDEQRYQEIMDDASTVDNVDENHDWQLSTSKVLMVDVSGLEGVERIQVFSGNPLESSSASIVGEAYVLEKNVVSMAITYPTLEEVLYAAAIDSEDNYTVSPFDPSASEVVNFSHPVANKKKMPYNYQPLSYTYLYEEEYPEPGDYDYNDVAVHISIIRSALRQVRINVELAAVGASEQVAFAIRLVGYRFSDIESVTTVDNASFDVVGGVEFPDQMRTVMIDKKDLLLSGLGEEAVLNIFADAHWATGDQLSADYGVMTRKRYNVSRTKDDTFSTFIPREITYVVTIKEGADVNYLSLGQLDAFAIKEYNGVNWEIHTPSYNNSQVLFPYPGVTIKTLPWALTVPDGSFHWPLHAVSIGSRHQGARSGAYHAFDHSFGEWAEDMTKCKDWYLYPDKDEVY